MTLVYDAGWQGKKVRGLIWFLLAVGVLFFWLASMEPTTPPPPEVESAAERLFARLFAVTAGLAMAGGILVYGRCYVSRVEVEDDGTVRVRTVGPFGSPEHVLAPGDIVSGRYHDGEFVTHEHAVNAPWYTVRVRGRRLPLILDPQGDFHDAARTELALGLESGSLAIREESRPLVPTAPKPILTEKERKHLKRARRRR
ncbi:MAG TPA: hypothetical protein VFR81_28235 [Longimicrobium sp.]|nr:hypothetical protein [Longimicrobium sp.]